MFGFKLRSWMENHIVRPRKKNNKSNKNGVLNTGGTTPNAVGERYGASTNKKDKNPNCNGSAAGVATSKTCGSLPRGSNCSTIGGRNAVISSPVRRREVSPIQNHTQSRYGWQSPSEQDIVTSPKSDNIAHVPRDTMRIQTPSQTNCNFNKEFTRYDHQSTSKHPHLLQQPQQTASSTSISSLSWSIGSKEQNQAKPHSSDGTFTNEEAVHYEEICTILRQPANPNSNRHFMESERPKSEQLTTFVPTSVFNGPKAYSVNQSSLDATSTRYGKLLPSRILNAPGPIELPNIGSSSAECLTHISGTMNFDSSSTIYPSPHREMPSSHQSIRGRFSNATKVVPSGNVALCSSVSSPESAYSSYSDGTSPGTVVSNCGSANATVGGYYAHPEYYINMRTGVHYFPKSVNPLTMEAHRYKIRLNKIEEMSPIDPLPKFSFMNNGGPPQTTDASQTFCHEPGSLSSRAQILMLPSRGFESPSPRERCRIRTNPWYSTNDPCQTPKHKPLSTVRTSAHKNENPNLDAWGRASLPAASYLVGTTFSNTKKSNYNFSQYTSTEDDSSSSLTEVEGLKRTPKKIKQRHYNISRPNLSTQSQLEVNRLKDNNTLNIWTSDANGSDDDATLNELMGKFDESYVYEKETDILSSDSDLTDCQSDMDTGQDAGDECDTEELLDIDFIDTSNAALEVHDALRNWGSCYYYNNNEKSIELCSNARTVSSPCRQPQLWMRSRRIFALPGSSANGTQYRRRRLMKTRKKCIENRSPLRKSRECRSVGGTPVCLRRNNTKENIRIHKTPTLSNRSSSLVFTDLRREPFRFAESEKALAKADLEADIKYRQLIMEAESIIMSMKSSIQSIPRDSTPVASPRRVANKRVEMLKNGEVTEQKRDAPQHQPHVANNTDQELAAAIHRRIDLIKYETASAPNSPNMSRLSPRKTHLTNFINQNIPPDIPPKKLQLSESITPPPPQLSKVGLSNYSHSQRSTNRSCSPHVIKPSDLSVGTDSEPERKLTSKPPIKLIHKAVCEKRMNAITRSSMSRITPHSFNVQSSDLIAYCPQSEPLKRKIYTSRSPFEQIEQNFDLEAESCKQPFVTKMVQLRRDRRSNSPSQILSTHSSGYDLSCPEVTDLSNEGHAANNHKRHLILNTIADLKRSLQEQSVELIGLND